MHNAIQPNLRASYQHNVKQLEELGWGQVWIQDLNGTDLPRQFTGDFPRTSTQPVTEGRATVIAVAVCELVNLGHGQGCIKTC